MTFSKLLVLVIVLISALIGVVVFIKGGHSTSEVIITKPSTPDTISVPLGTEIRQVKPLQLLNQTFTPLETETKIESNKILASSVQIEPPEVDRVEMLFNKTGPKFPFVETIVYKSRVPWQKGRPAWLADYATHFATSRHFIARSLNGKVNYTKQDLAEGDRFNVFRKDCDITFHLVADLSRCRLWLYCCDIDKHVRYLIKTYQIGVGRRDQTCTSGLLTPRGVYSLGNKIAIYKPKMQGFYNGKKVEMLRVFGTRWIPFEKEIKGCTAPAKTLGIHGVPWTPSANGDLVEDLSSIGKYESDGCVRLATSDMEEIFAIIITKPATMELVADFNEADLPGTEWRVLDGSQLEFTHHVKR